jgi:predicted enzyme related to lactoylglutathione lyase
MPVKSICGAILIATKPGVLATFYSQGLGLAFTREEHAGLATHWGVDIGHVHFGIHPPENFQCPAVGNASVVLAFDVTSLEQCRQQLEALGAKCIQPPHDEGFGLVASFADPEGNQFEVVELAYSFDSTNGA